MPVKGKATSGARGSSRAKGSTSLTPAKRSAAKRGQPRTNATTPTVGDLRREVAKDLAHTQEELAKQIQELEKRVRALRAEAERAIESDPITRAAEAFVQEMRALLRGSVPSIGAVKRAARLAVAEHVWEDRLGELVDAREAAELLGVSRQAISRMVADHRLIGLPKASRGYRFPAWQFTLNAYDRAQLARSHQILVSEGKMSPWSAASWFINEHPELNGIDPVRFVRSGGSARRLQETAERDALRASQ